MIAHSSVAIDRFDCQPVLDLSQQAKSHPSDNIETLLLSLNDRLSRRAYRRRLYKYDRRCAYCRREMKIEKTTLDHIVPVSQGGANTAKNLLLCCLECNRMKRDRTLAQWAEDLFELAVRFPGEVDRFRQIELIVLDSTELDAPIETRHQPISCS